MNILFLDDSSARWQKFWAFNGTRHNCSWAESAEAAINLLSHQTFHYISLDHDLCVNDQNKRSGFEVATGLEAAKYIAKHPDCSPSSLIVLHSYNAWGVRCMAGVLDAASRNVIIQAFDPEKPQVESIVKVAESRGWKEE